MSLSAGVKRNAYAGEGGGIGGSIAGDMVGTDMANMLARYGMQSVPMEYMRQGVMGATDAATGMAADYLLLPEGQRPTREEMLQNAAVQGLLRGMGYQFSGRGNVGIDPRLEAYRDDEAIRYTAPTQLPAYEPWMEAYRESEVYYRNLLQPSQNGDIIKKKMISGALNPEDKQADEHAVRYYGLVRSMSTDVEKIAKNTGYSQDEIQEIKDFIFTEEHELSDGIHRFEPDYTMAESWRRLMEGKNIQPHDLTLIRHEIMERNLMKQGISQTDAHTMTSKIYNYKKESRDYYAKIDKYKKDR